MWRNFVEVRYWYICRTGMEGCTRAVRSNGPVSRKDTPTACRLSLRGVENVARGQYSSQQSQSGSGGGVPGGRLEDGR